MIIKSLDGTDVEVTHCDAGYQPGGTPNPILNVGAVWCKPSGGEWFRSIYRSAMKTAEAVKHTDVKDLKETLSEKSETVHDRESAATITDIQPVQGHSTGDADKEPT